MECWTAPAGRKKRFHSSDHGLKALKQELEMYVDALENSSSLVSKEVQRQNDIVMSSIESQSWTKQVNSYNCFSLSCCCFLLPKNR